MISELSAYAFCKDDITKIENYDIAVNDKDNYYDCHHKLEIGSDYINSAADMILMGIYYHRPAEELIFLKHGEHTALHSRRRSPEALKKIRNANVGRKASEECRQKMREAWERRRLRRK